MHLLSFPRRLTQAHNKSLLSSPRRWLFVFTDAVGGRKAFWNNVGPILASTETAVVRRTVSPYSRCGRLSEGCQLRLATDSLRLSITRISANLTREEERLLRQNRKMLKNGILSETRLLLHCDWQTSACGTCDRFDLQVCEKKERATTSAPWLRRKPVRPSVWNENQDFDVHIHATGGWTPVKGYMAKNQVFAAWAKDGAEAAARKER